MKKITCIRKGRLAAFRVLAACLLTAALTGCGNSYDSAKEMSAEFYSTASTADTAAYDNGSYMFEEAEAGGVMDAEAYPQESPEGVSVSEVQAAERKLIKTVNVRVETENFDTLIPGIERQVEALGGYIENISVNSRDRAYSQPDYDGTGYLCYASMTVRIPKENLDAFLSQVDEESNVVYRSEDVTDVTLQYVDLESHKTALLTEQDRLLELMEQAETVEDIIAIEGRLSEVRYQLESMESQLRTFDNRIDYSTVYLDIEEVKKYTPAEDIGVGEKIRNGFVDSLEGVGRGISNFAIWFVINIPYLVIWAVVIIVAVVIIRLLFKKRALKKALKLQQVLVTEPVNQQPVTQQTETAEKE